MTQTVLVTGASGGVGRAVAQRFRNDGATVLAGYRDPAAVHALVAMGCQPVRLDVTDESDLMAAIKDAPDIDVLVNAAGVSQGGPLEELPLAALRRQFEVNVLGALRTAQLVAPGMRLRGHGRIINVSSVAGRITFPGMGAYAMSKHALESMSQALRHELKPFGIGVSVIQPGGIDTPFAEAERRTYLHGLPEGPYAEFTVEVIERLSHNPAPLSADKVARTILRAATARHPKGQYRVGTIAHVMLGLHDALPGRLWDRLLPMMAPTPKLMPKPASAPKP